jgi:hypothetical protein
MNKPTFEDGKNWEQKLKTILDDILWNRTRTIGIDVEETQLRIREIIGEDGCHEYAYRIVVKGLQYTESWRGLEPDTEEKIISRLIERIQK